MSLVGFKFEKTKVWGVSWPWHKNFLEVNLRYYVKRIVDGQERRGVVFIREFVPKRMITFMANKLYKENYKSIGIETEQKRLPEELSVKYAILKNGPQIFGVQTENTAWAMKEGGIEEFITEHYYGYTKAGDNKTIEYGVEHPRWSCYPVKFTFLKFDFANVYGPEFSFLNNVKPHSVVMAEGSEILVRKPVRLKLNS